MERLLEKKGFICDMDGVIYHGNQLLPGVQEFVEWLYREGKKFLFLTNNSGKTPRELRDKLARMGLEVDESHFYTSSLATASFIASQTPGAKVFAIGDPGLTHALYEKGLTLDDVAPDYVVIGETASYTYDNICKAVKLVNKGARHRHQLRPDRPHGQWGHHPRLPGAGGPGGAGFGQNGLLCGQAQPPDDAYGP